MIRFGWLALSSHCADTGLRLPTPWPPIGGADYQRAGKSKEGKMRKFIQLLLDNRGIGGIEYALIASLISVAALGAYQELGKGVDQQYVEIDNSLEGAL